ncbi:MAG: energy-coupling factor transporter ATPase [Tissierellia bacterium]|nr:energy-coupling factor transporter ATPase [Tissierellia bacterium]
MSILKMEEVKYVYSPNTPFEKVALQEINFSIDQGEFIGLIGHTGSGKSTLVQHLNGLMKPTEGRVIVNGINISEKGQNLTDVRRNVGLVFQYPEYQLFEETIEKDIAFGPQNLNLSEEEVQRRVKDAMESVGLDFETYRHQSPFELSGGQKRRVAIAGVLAMEPQVLILDEPTAGLDPQGRDEILDEIKAIYDRWKISIILVSHSMEDVAKIANRLIVMDKGKIIMDDTPREIFKREDQLKQVGLGIPQITSFMRSLQRSGIPVETDCITVEEAKTSLEEYLRRQRNA